MLTGWLGLLIYACIIVRFLKFGRKPVSRYGE